MDVIFKVGRCNINKYRLGLHIHSLTENNFNNVSRVQISGISDNDIVIENLSWYRKYQTIQNREISNWVRNNRLGHEPRQPIHLLYFTLSIENNENGEEIHKYTYVNVSKYMKKSGSKNGYHKYYECGRGQEICLQDELEQLKSSMRESRTRL